MNIMQKELDHTKRIKAMRDKENSEIESKRKQRDVRVQSARVKKYYDEYSTRMKSSMLKNKTKEEQVCLLLIDLLNFIKFILRLCYCQTSSTVCVTNRHAHTFLFVTLYLVVVCSLHHLFNERATQICKYSRRFDQGV